jgi:hypothetical protein
VVLIADYRICQIPLVARGKVPLVVRWSSLSIDDPIWKETFAAHPECNIGYRLDNLVVVDCDSAERVGWWIEQGFPTDFMSRGRPERRSFWYRQPEDDDPIGIARFADWEVRAGAGAQCAVPPSIHPDTGRPYEWLGPPVDEDHWWEIPEAPADFLREQHLAARTPPVGGWSVVEAGGRDNFLISVGGLLRAKGMAYGAIRDGIATFNQMFCHPPKSAADVERISRSAASYSPEVTLVMEGAPTLITRKSRYRRTRR